MLSYSSAGSGGAGGLDSPLEFFEPPCMKIVPTPLLLYGNAFWGGLGVILAGGPAHCRYATVLKPCILESVKLVLGEKASQTMKQISLSNDTIKSRIHEMSDNIKSKMLSKIDSSPVFALQLDESTDISNLSQLLVYVRYVADERINEKFLFCQPLETTLKAVDVFQMLIDFFDKTELSWNKLFVML